MRSVPEALAARIESGAATLCHAWIVVLSDGERLGFTDHDRDLQVEDVACRANRGWSVGAAHQELGLEAGLASASGILSVEGPIEADILTGRWDGARVEVWRVEWSEPGLRVLLEAGTISRLVRHGERIVVEIEGPLAMLNQVVGRTYGRLCDAVLGDARCGVDTGEHPDAVCDKRFSTCHGQFANAPNFRGFPDMPGDDFLMARPQTGGRHDGGSRR